MIVCLASATNSSSNYQFFFDQSEMDYNKLCSNLPDWCNCNNNPIDSPYEFECSHDDIELKVGINLSDDMIYLIYIHCVNVSSFKLFPDLTDYFGFSEIIFMNCMVPRNGSIKQLTTKISKKVRNLWIFIDNEEMNLKFDKNYFEGLSSLERLNLYVIPNISADIIEIHFKLKNMFLEYTPIPNNTSIFDTLENLQTFTIYSNFDIEIQSSDFKNLKNLVQLYIFCSDNCSKCSLDPFIFENLVNLRILQITNFRIPGIKLANMMNLQQVRLAKTDFKELPEDFFKNSTKISPGIDSNW